MDSRIESSYYSFCLRFRNPDLYPSQGTRYAWQIYWLLALTGRPGSTVWQHYLGGVRANFSVLICFCNKNITRRINVTEASREPSDHSLTSSSIIMPNLPSSHFSSPSRTNGPFTSTAPGSSVTVFSKLRSNSDFEDDMSDTSSVSLVSASLSEEDEDARMWEASRAHAGSVEDVAQNMEYVLLYDDNTSEED